MVQKRFFKACGEHALEQETEEMASQYGSASFIAQNESQGRYVGGDVLSVIEAAVGACAEDTSYAGTVSAEGSCCSHEVGLYFSV